VSAGSTPKRARTDARGKSRLKDASPGPFQLTSVSPAQTTICHIPVRSSTHHTPSSSPPAFPPHPTPLHLPTPPLLCSVPMTPLVARCPDYASEPIMWDAPFRQQLLDGLVELGYAVESAFDGTPQVQ